MFCTFGVFGSYEIHLNLVVCYLLMNCKPFPGGEAARKCILDACVHAAKIWGHSDAVGILRGSLLLSDGPRSLDDLVDDTGYSKSTVSTSMSILERQGLVQRTVKPGDKRYYYVSVEDADATFNAQKEKTRQVASIILTAVDQAERYLENMEESGPNEEMENLCRRLAAIRYFYTKIQKIMDLAGRFTVEELIEILEREVSR